MARRGGPSKGLSKHQMQGLEFDRYGGEMPAFLKRMTGETAEGRAEQRRREMPEDSDSEPEGAGATVVVLKKGDLTAEEVEAIREGRAFKRDADDAGDATEGSPKQDAEDESGDDDDGTIKFRKPKKSKLDAEKSSDGKKKTYVKEKKRKDVKAVNNSALLSFGGEDDE